MPAITYWILYLAVALELRFQLTYFLRLFRVAREMQDREHDETVLPEIGHAPRGNERYPHSRPT